MEFRIGVLNPETVRVEILRERYKRALMLEVVRDLMLKHGIENVSVYQEVPVRAEQDIRVWIGDMPADEIVPPPAPVLEVSAGGEPDNGPFVCVECGKPFPTKKQLILHRQRAHLAKRPDPCPHCKKQCANVQALATHLKMHQGEPGSAGGIPS